MMTALRYRRDHAALFLGGEYLPLEAGGVAHKHVCAFSRRLDRQSILTVFPRLITGLNADPSLPPLGAQAWGDTWINVPNGAGTSRYRNLFTDEILVPKEQDGRYVLLLAELLSHCPVALMEKVS
jgi:(1->4)-alpha-D-glucan 1-alpha-D-glucosylmutase